MDKKHQSHYFLFIALSVSIVVVYFIIKPFLGPLILAAVFAFLFQPIYKKFLNYLKKRESVAAFSTTIVAIFLILLPISILGTQIFKESSQLYQTLTSENNNFVSSMEEILNRTRTVLPIPADFKLDFGQYAKQGLEVLIQNFGAVFSSFAKIIINAFVFLTAFYFFIKDGNRLKNYFVDLSPLDDTDDEFIVSRLKSAVSAAMKGNLAIGIIQGALTGIGFAIFGVPNPVLWGGVAAIAAFLPGIGTSLVIIPAIIFLFLTGNTFGGVGLLVWGVTAVGLVDNFLGPKLVGRGMQLHPLAVFIAVLGGLVFFGPLGFLLGPLAMSVCLALFDIYSSLKLKESQISH
ncbi:MAG: AI-2E family transporter [Candidatus Paceibacterota bacterium]|nr:MAG: AI-2E family transporter [Candidatus Paceibacterota bacterium]